MASTTQKKPMSRWDRLLQSVARRMLPYANVGIPLPTGLIAPVTKASNFFLFQEVFLQPGYLEMLALLPTPKTVCDLGVNHGYFELACEHYKRQHHIHTPTQYVGVDANPSCIAASRKNFEKNLLPGTFSLELGCIGQPGTTIDFYVDKNDLLSSATQHTRHAKRLRIPAADLAAIFKRYFPDGCDLLKVDVQGAEVLLLDYWSNVIAENCRAVILEYHPFCGLKPLEFKARWEKMGFTARQFPENEEGELLALFTRNP